LIKRGLIPITPIQKQPGDRMRLDLSHRIFRLFYWVRRPYYKPAPAAVITISTAKRQKKIFRHYPFFAWFPHLLLKGV
jgi:hypothetical protein